MHFFNLCAVLIQKSDVCILPNTVRAAILNFQNGHLSIFNFAHITAIDRHRVMNLVSIPTFIYGKHWKQQKYYIYIYIYIYIYKQVYILYTMYI